MNQHLSRRTVLKGLGVSLALPWLEAMMPRSALAAKSAKHPLRMAMLYVGNGVRKRDWTLAETGPLPRKLPFILEPLEGLQADFSVLGNLSNRASVAPDGAAHTRPQGAFLTGMRPRPGTRADARLGVSADQVAAARIGDQTRLPSLSVTSQCARGEYDYGDWYHNLSWRDAVTPISSKSTSTDLQPLVLGRRRRSIFDRRPSEHPRLRESRGYGAEAARFKRGLAQVGRILHLDPRNRGAYRTGQPLVGANAPARPDSPRGIQRPRP